MIFDRVFNLKEHLFCIIRIHIFVAQLWTSVINVQISIFFIFQIKKIVLWTHICVNVFSEIFTIFRVLLLTFFGLFCFIFFNSFPKIILFFNTCKRLVCSVWYLNEKSYGYFFNPNHQFQSATGRKSNSISFIEDTGSCWYI